MATRRGEWVREKWVDASAVARHEGLDWDVYVAQSVVDLCAPPEAGPGTDPRSVPPAVRDAWLRNVQSVVRGLAITIPQAKHGPFFCCTAWCGEGIRPGPAHEMLYDVRRDGAVRRYCVRPGVVLHPEDPRRPRIP